MALPGDGIGLKRAECNLMLFVGAQPEQGFEKAASAC